jgi:hypothetical protein
VSRQAPACKVLTIAEFGLKLTAQSAPNRSEDSLPWVKNYVLFSFECPSKPVFCRLSYGKAL